MKIVVLGGTGRLGQPVAKQLQSDGFEVTILTSDQNRAFEALGPEFRIVECDVTDRNSLSQVLIGQEGVYINLNAQLDAEKYRRTEVEGTANVAVVAAEQGLKRIVLVSTSVTGESETGVVYHDAKVRAERAVIQSGVPYTIMRASCFFETLPGFIQMGKAIIVGEQPERLGWLAVSDYARQVSRAFQTEEAANKCFYNIGSEKMTMMEALSKYCARRRPDLHPEVIPIWKAKLTASLPGLAELQHSIPFFEYFSKVNEDVDPTETTMILGPATTTMDQWLDSFNEQGDRLNACL